MLQYHYKILLERKSLNFILESVRKCKVGLQRLINNRENHGRYQEM